MSNRTNDTSEKSKSRPRVENLPRREEELQPHQAEAAGGGTFAWHQSVVEGSFKAPDLDVQRVER